MSSLRGSLQFAFSGKQRQCRFCLFGVERDFDFFPAAFSLFIVSVLFVLCLVATRSLFIHRHLLWIGSGSTNGLQLVMDIDDMIWSSLRRQWSSWTECSSFTVHRGDGVLQCILDWILAHCVMLLAVWESLFNFYRHFTTMYAAKHFCSVETPTIFCRFSIYALSFGAVFMVNLHFYFWLFPVTLALHFLFNLFCAWSFAHILVEQYKHLMSPDTFSNEVHDEMLRSVFLMRRLSMWSSLVSTGYLALFLVAHDIAIVHCLPSLWAISAMLMTLNFVRNRQLLHRLVLRLKHCIVARGFSLKRSTDWAVRAITTEGDGAGDGDRKQTVLSPTARSNGSIAALRRGHRIRTSSTMSTVPYSKSRRMHHHEGTLSATAITPQASVLHICMLSNEALPTVRERVDGVDGVDGIDDEDTSESFVSEVQLSDDAPDDEGSVLDELHDADCVGTPSSRATKASDGSIDAVLSSFPELQDSASIFIRKPKGKRPTISITAPPATDSLWTDRVECRPRLLSVRTRSATMDHGALAATPEPAPRPQSATSHAEQREKKGLTLHDVRSDGAVGDQSSTKSACVTGSYPTVYSVPSNAVSGRRPLSSSARSANAQKRPSTNQSSSLPAPVHGMRPSISAPQTTEDVVSECQGSCRLNGVAVPTFDVTVDVDDNDEIEFYSTASSECEHHVAAPFIDHDGDIPSTHDRIEREFFPEQHHHGPVRHWFPSTPSRSGGQKALSVLGIGSNESGARTPSHFGHSFPRRLKLTDSHSANPNHCSRGKPIPSPASILRRNKDRLMTKLSGSRSVRAAKSMERNTVSGGSLNRHEHRRRHLLPQFDGAQSDRDRGVDDECQPFKASDAETDGVFHGDLLENAGRTTLKSANRSFSKTLTQSEWRDIPYDVDGDGEDHEMVLMEGTPSVSSDGDHIAAITDGVITLQSRGQSAGDTVFVSNSYHRDNVLCANNHALNRRVFNLLHDAGDGRGGHMTSSVPPKEPTASTADPLELRKARSAPDEHDESESLKDCNPLKLMGIPSQVDDVIMDIGRLRRMNDSARTLKRSRGSSRSTSRRENRSGSEADSGSDSRCRPMECWDDEDDTLCTLNGSGISGSRNTMRMDAMDSETLTFSVDADADGLGIGAIGTVLAEKGRCQHFDDDSVSVPSPKPRPRPHASSRSLLDGLGRFASLFGHSQSHRARESMSQSASKSTKARHQKRATSMPSMPSMPSMEAMNGSQSKRSSRARRGTQIEDGDGDGDEEGDIVNVLSVLVHHGFYSKQNLNSVQQLTHFNDRSPAPGR